MADPFTNSHKKIERAEKHIADINSTLLEFTNDPCSHSAEIKFDRDTGQNFLRISLREDLFPADKVALTIGDALHNLRSALDLMYYGVIENPTDWSRFPFDKTREELEKRWLVSALKQKQISSKFGKFVLDTIKPYEAGNPILWGLHNLNIIDKHKLLIPVLKLVAITGISLEDDKGRQVGHSTYFIDESCEIRLRDADDRNVTVKDKGKVPATVLFGEGTPFHGDGVVVALMGITEEVTRTIEAVRVFVG
jgi:hypothetical protein